LKKYAQWGFLVTLSAILTAVLAFIGGAPQRSLRRLAGLLCSGRSTLLQLLFCMSQVLRASSGLFCNCIHMRNVCRARRYGFFSIYSGLGNFGACNHCWGCEFFVLGWQPVWRLDDSGPHCDSANVRSNFTDQARPRSGSQSCALSNARGVAIDAHDLCLHFSAG
jgi:hypothetical protein